MLEIKVAEHHEITTIQEILKDENVYLGDIEECIQNCMIAYDKKRPVAVAGFMQKKNIGIIKFVVVSRDRRREYLGDGIVKALLNLADRKGIYKVFVSVDKDDFFFERVGFKETSLEEVKKNFDDQVFLSLLSKDKLLQVNLPDYFLKACKHK